MEGTVHDADGVLWECAWERVAGYLAASVTRVDLRRPGSEQWTHFVDARWPCEVFRPVLIEGQFRPIPIFGPRSTPDPQ